MQEYELRNLYFEYLTLKKLDVNDYNAPLKSIGKPIDWSTVDFPLGFIEWARQKDARVDDALRTVGVVGQPTPSPVDLEKVTVEEPKEEEGVVALTKEPMSAESKTQLGQRLIDWGMSPESALSIVFEVEDAYNSPLSGPTIISDTLNAAIAQYVSLGNFEHTLRMEGLSFDEFRSLDSYRQSQLLQSAADADQRRREAEDTSYLRWETLRFDKELGLDRLRLDEESFAETMSLRWAELAQTAELQRMPYEQLTAQQKAQVDQFNKTYDMTVRQQDYYEITSNAKLALETADSEAARALARDQYKLDLAKFGWDKETTALAMAQTDRRITLDEKTAAANQWIKQAELATNRAQLGADLWGQERTRQQNAELARENIAAGLGPRDWLQKWQLSGNVGLPHPGEVGAGWLGMLGVDVEKANEVWAQNSEWRAEAEKRRQQEMADQSQYLSDLEKWQQSNLKMSQWAEKRAGLTQQWGGMENNPWGQAIDPNTGMSNWDTYIQQTIGSQPDVGGQPLMPQGGQQGVGVPFTSWITDPSNRAQLAGPQTWSNMGLENRQKASGLWEMQGYGGQQAQAQMIGTPGQGYWSGVTSAPLAKGRKVWGY